MMFDPFETGPIRKTLVFDPLTPSLHEFFVRFMDLRYTESLYYEDDEKHLWKFVPVGMRISGDARGKLRMELDIAITEQILEDKESKFVCGKDECIEIIPAKEGAMKEIVDRLLAGVGLKREDFKFKK